MIGNQTAREIRRPMAIERVVEMILSCELTDLSDLRIIDLNFIDRRGGLRDEGDGSAEEYQLSCVPPHLPLSNDAR